MDCRRSAAVTCVLYCIVCVCVTHTVVSDPLQGVAQVEIKTPVVCSRFTRLQALLERHNMAASGLRLFKKNLKINNEVFYLQVRNTLCYLVLGLQDEAVVNFGEAVAGGNRQNLWEKHRCQTTNHRQACVSGNSSAYSTHTSSYTFLAPLLSPSNRWATPRSFFRLMSSGNIWVNRSRVAREPRIRPETWQKHRRVNTALSPKISDAITHDRQSSSQMLSKLRFSLVG